MPLTKLNKEQLTAATAPLGKNLVIASAGTGKTSTIVARIAHLLNSGVEARKILLLTFTNKASAQMIARLERYFDKDITSAIMAGTFHSVSFKLLKKLNKNIALKPPRELKILLKSLLERRKFYHLGDQRPYGGAYLYDIYSLFQNKELDKNFYEWFCQNYDEQALYAEIYSDVIDEFEREKERFGYVDFNDLLIRMKRELKKGAPIYFDEILVDEYQDTNTLQGALIDAFTTNSLFCVGDFDQSIYAFNGANIDIIGSFKDRYKDARVYNLNINYRSTPSILKLANRVIANNPRLYPKELVVHRDGNFSAPKLLVFDELFSQYKNIAKSIEASKYKKEDIAVIFRNNSSADGMEASLRELGIASKRRGGVSFFDSVEIKAVIDIISILINPKDIMGFISTISYATGVGNAAAKELYEALLTLGDGSIIKGLLSPNREARIFEQKQRNYQLGLFDEVDLLESADRFDGLDSGFSNNPVLTYQKLTKDGAKFLNSLYLLAKNVKKTSSSNSTIEQILNSQLYQLISLDIARKRATRKNGTIDSELQKEALIRINNKSKILFEIAKKHSELYDFYNFLTISRAELEEGSGVNLLSVHASKGLEFRQVFIVDLAQNRFPNIKLMGMGGSLEEERRLFYVAVTRAMDELVMSYAKNDKIRKIEYKPSIFLQEAGFIKEGF